MFRHLRTLLTVLYAALFGVALVLGFGNGLGSGIVMTLGADRAPAVGRASFLAVWRMVSDGGTAAGPLVDSIVVGLGVISFAGPVVGVIGLACGFVVLRYLQEPEHQAEVLPGGAAPGP